MELSKTIKRAIFVALLMPFAAVANERIFWLVDDEKELQHLREGKPRSISVDVVYLVTSKLSSFHLQMKVTSVSRMKYELENTENTCVANRIKTEERKNYSVFSSAISLHPTPRVYCMSDKLTIGSDILDSEGHLLSLMHLLDANPSAELTIVKDASYGHFIDNQIKSIPEQKIQYLNVDNRYQTSPKLLVEGFADITVENPGEFRRQMASLGNPENAKGIGLSGAIQFVLGHVACSKSELGAKVVAQVNEVFKDIAGTQTHYSAHLPYIDAQQMQEFTSKYKDKFGTK